MTNQLFREDLTDGLAYQAQTSFTEKFLPIINEISPYKGECTVTAQTTFTEVEGNITGVKTVLNISFPPTHDLWEQAYQEIHAGLFKELAKRLGMLP